MKASHRTLLFVPSIQHLEFLSRSNRGLMQTSVVATADFNVGVKLEKMGVPYHFFQTYLTEEVHIQNLELVSQILKLWPVQCLSHLCHRGINVAEATRNDMWYAFLGCLNAKVSFSLLLDDVRPDLVHLFNEFSTPTFGDTQGGPYPDVLNALLAWVAEARNIRIRYFPGLSSPATVNELSRISQVEHYGPMPEDLKHVIERRRRAKQVILAYGSYIDFAELEPLHDRLWDDSETLFVFVRSHLFKVEKRENTVLNFWDFLCWPFDLGGLYRQIDLAWRNFLTSDAPVKHRFQEIFDNPLLRFQFRAYFDSLKRCGKVIEAARLLVDMLKPGLCLTGWDGSGDSRCFVQSVKRMGVPTLCFMHGAILPERDTERMNSTADYMAVQGKALARRFIASGRLPAKVAVTGDLHLLPNAHKKSDTHKAVGRYCFDKMSESLATFVKNRPLVLLVTSSMGYGLYMPRADLVKHRTAWNAIADMARNRPDLAFVIKAHPRYDYYDLYENLCRPWDSNLFLLKNASLINALSRTDLAVLVNGSSTAAVETAAAGVPILYLRYAAYKTKPGYGSPLDQDGCLLVDEIEDLEKAIDQTLFNSTARRAIIEAGHRLLQDYCTFMGEEALERAFEVIASIILSKKSHLSNENCKPGSLLAFYASAIRHFLHTGNDEHLKEAINRLRSLSGPFGDPSRWLQYLQEIARQWSNDVNAIILPGQFAHILDLLSMPPARKRQCLGDHHLLLAFKAFKVHDSRTVVLNIMRALLLDPLFLRRHLDQVPTLIGSLNKLGRLSRLGSLFTHYIPR